MKRDMSKVCGFKDTDLWREAALSPSPENDKKLKKYIAKYCSKCRYDYEGICMYDGEE